MINFNIASQVDFIFWLEKQLNKYVSDNFITPFHRVKMYFIQVYTDSIKNVNSRMKVTVMKR